MKYYTLDDYTKIRTSADDPITVESSVTTLLEKLSNELGISIAPPTHSHGHHGHSQNYSGRRPGRKSEDSWIQPKVQFKVTKIEKDTTSTMNEIRTCLNKMSVKNFETSKNTLLEWVRKTTEDKLCIVAQNIFDIASTNKFFSEMYAEIYKVLLEQKEDLDVEIFRNILQKFLTEFTDTMRDIKYVDPANNYDAFCDYNKKNDARRATSLFIINLTKKGVIESSTFLTILRNIFDIVELYMNETGRLNEVEEITENIFLLVSEYIKFLKQEDKKDKEKDNEWVKLAEQIKVFAGLKAKERASLSSRAIFKYTDLLESM